MIILHCWSRFVHCPDAHCRPFPHELPSGFFTSAGQNAEVPEQVSCGSHCPVLARQTVEADANWQLRQQSSLRSSQTDPVVNLQVVGLQHALPWQFAVPPQSQSSPVSTIPLPQMGSLIVETRRLSVKQVPLTELRERAVQTFPIVHKLNVSTPGDEDGFMIYLRPASHELPLSGQHCWDATKLASAHALESQSWTAPYVCPVSCAMTCHSLAPGVRTTTFAPAYFAPFGPFLVPTAQA
jgi:hypothetical protein